MTPAIEPRISRQAAHDVVLLGVDSPIGLTIIRELGERGVRVIGLGGGNCSLGKFSRFISEFHVRESNEDRLIEQISAIASATNSRCVMAISEADIGRLNRNRANLSGIKLLIPGADQMALALDKQRTLELARQVGIDVPRTWACGSLEGAGNPPEDLRFPVVLKWADPGRVARALARHQLPFVKAQYCHDRRELTATLLRYAPIKEFPLVQEYCHGSGLGHFVFMHQGKAMLVFQHERIHEWPPEGGVSTLCRSLPCDDGDPLLQKSIALLRRMGWEGHAMVEYRWDKERGTAKLMEVNGRFWGSLPLAHYAGAHFAAMSYYTLGLGLPLRLAEYRTGVWCLFMLPELKRLWRILFRRERISDPFLKVAPTRDVLLLLGRLFSPTTRYYVGSLKDPLPMIADLVCLVRDRIRR